MFDPCHTLRYMTICHQCQASVLWLEPPCWAPLPPDYYAFPNSATKESRTLAELRLASGTTNSSHLKP